MLCNIIFVLVNLDIGICMMMKNDIDLVYIILTYSKNIVTYILISSSCCSYP
jgi:hypothetical protein